MPYYPSALDYMQPQPFVQPFAQQRQQPQQNQETSLNWCLGEAGAKAYFVARGCTVPIFDKDEPVVYIKSVDPSGIPSMKILDYKEREPVAPKAEPVKEYATKEDLQELREQIAALTQKKAKKEAATE